MDIKCWVATGVYLIRATPKNQRNIEATYQVHTLNSILDIALISVAVDYISFKTCHFRRGLSYP